MKRLRKRKRKPPLDRSISGAIIDLTLIEQCKEAAAYTLDVLERIEQNYDDSENELDRSAFRTAYFELFRTAKAEMIGFMDLIALAEKVVPNLRSDPTISQTFEIVSTLMEIIKNKDLKMTDPAGSVC